MKCQVRGILHLPLHVALQAVGKLLLEGVVATSRNCAGAEEASSGVGIFWNTPKTVFTISISRNGVEVPFGA